MVQSVTHRGIKQVSLYIFRIIKQYSLFIYFHSCQPDVHSL